MECSSNNDNCIPYIKQDITNGSQNVDIETMQKLLSWGVSLSFYPKLLLSAVIVAIAILILIGLWWAPPNKEDDPGRNAESRSQTVTNNTGNNNPVIQGHNNTVIQGNNNTQK